MNRFGGRNKMTKFIIKPRFMYIMYGIVFILIVAVVIVTVLNVRKNRSVVIMSYDKQATIVLENVVDYRPKMIPQNLRNRFTSNNINVFKKCIRKNEAYLYSIEEDGSRSQNETGKYLLCKDHRYFVIERNDHVDSNGKNQTGYYVTQAFVAVSRLYETYQHHVFFPVVIEDGVLDYKDPVFFKWSDTVGLNSFEDLKEFYGRIEDEYYSIDENEKSITLHSAFIKGAYDVLKLHADEDGITIERLKK